MAKNTSDFLLARLNQWGIKRIFGYPGDGINGILGALERAKDKFEFIQVRHEEMAAFMACGHAKLTGEIGVCLATSGPGAIHLLNGLYDAKMDHQPVLAIVGQQATASLGGEYQQEVDLNNLFKDVAHEYVHMATNPNQIRHLVDRAIRIAKAERTVTCIIIPNDVQEMEAVKELPRKHGIIHSGVGYTNPLVIPKKKDLQRAAEILNQGNKVAMLVGAGALTASQEVLEVANILGAGIAKALLGRAVVSDEIPFVTGTIGLLGTAPSYELMKNCDTLLMVGSSFPYSEFLPPEGKARGIQIDLDGRMLSLRYPMEVNLIGGSAETLRALIPLLKQNTDKSWQQHITHSVKKWWELVEDRAMMPAHPINPQRLFWELSSQLPPNVILTIDTGTVTDWYARDIKIQQGMMAILSGNLATMGPAVPYAIAAKFAYPERVVIAIVGDGAMQMNGNNELITIAKYWHLWRDPRLLIVVLNNRELNQVTWEQRALAGDPKFSASQDIPDFPYASYAKLLNLDGIRIEKPEELAAAIHKGLSADRPFILDVVTDPDVPPISHLTAEQTEKFFLSILKHDPDASGVIKNTFRQFFARLIKPFTKNKNL